MSYAEANAFHRLVRTTAATAPVAWIYARTLHWLDKAVLRATKGRTTFAALVSGLSVIQLTTIGARTGRPRTWPLLGVRDGGDIVVIASNWGRSRHPAWYHNLLRTPHATAVVDGVAVEVVAREVDGAERDRIWQRAIRIYPGWAAYERRAAPRRIPVLVLTRA